MKANIHPAYQEITVTCVCGHSFKTRSTAPKIDLEICSECHPFYTGKQKLVDSAGRVERFRRRYAKPEASATPAAGGTAKKATAKSTPAGGTAKKAASGGTAKKAASGGTAKKAAAGGTAKKAAAKSTSAKGKAKGPTKPAAPKPATTNKASDKTS